MRDFVDYSVQTQIIIAICFTVPPPQIYEAKKCFEEKSKEFFLLMSSQLTCISSRLSSLPLLDSYKSLINTLAVSFA